MKKLISVILAVCLAMLSALTFTACDSDIELPQDNGTYYAYDSVTEEYNDNDCMEIDGTACKMIGNFNGVKMTVDGTVEINNSSVVVRCSLGEDDSTVDIAMFGEKEADGVIRFFRQEITSGDNTITQYIVEYYCKKGCAPKKEQPGESDGVYYEYDPSEKQYDESSAVTINGSACKFSAGGFDFNGTVNITGSSIVLESSMLGFRTVYMGVKEKDGVIRIDSITLTSESNEEINYTETTVVYYCKKGVTPDNPILSEQNPPDSDMRAVVFNANGGSFGTGNTYTKYTYNDGTVSLPYSNPEREGYVFVRYDTKQDGTGTTVDETTVFTQSTTVYAQWAKEVTVTFRNNGLNISKKKVGKGTPLGDFTVPGIDKYDYDPLFKGWYNGSKQYTSSTIVEDDITLTAQWYTASDIQRYINSLNASTKPGHIYVHYWRYDHDHSEEGTKTKASAPLYSSPIDSKIYGDWIIWARHYESYDKGNGRPFYPSKIDMSGAVYDIDYTYIYHDAGDDRDLDVAYNDGELSVRFIAASTMKGSEWKWETDGYDNHLFNFNDRWLGYDHVFFIQDKTYHAVYYNSQTGEFI